MPLTHTTVTQTLQQVIESIILNNWRTLTKEQLLQAAAHLRTVKAQYVTSHMTLHLSIQQEILSPIDQGLLTLYLLIDRLEGRDLAEQQAFYQALLSAQTPLLAAYSTIPPDTLEEQTKTDNSSIAETIVQKESLLSSVDETVPDREDRAATDLHAATEQSSSSSNWFRWTEEREQTLHTAVTRHAGSLDKVNGAIIKQIAAELNWPYKSIEYKISRWRKSREGQREETSPEKEED